MIAIYSQPARSLAYLPSVIRILELSIQNIFGLNFLHSLLISTPNHNQILHICMQCSFTYYDSYGNRETEAHTKHFCWTSQKNLKGFALSRVWRVRLKYKLRKRKKSEMMLTGDKTKVNTKTSRARATTHSQGLIWDASFYDSDQVACVKSPENRNRKGCLAYIVDIKQLLFTLITGDRNLTPAAAAPLTTSHIADLGQLSLRREGVNFYIYDKKVRFHKNFSLRRFSVGGHSVKKCLRQYFPFHTVQQ